MNRIDAAFADLRARKARAVMPFIVGGAPGFGDTALLIPALARAGATVIEIGIPFSDPIADGPVIAESMHKAIARGATPRAVFEQIAAARKHADAAHVGLVAMMSVSIAWRIGFDQTVALAAECGIDGFIFPDLPLEESAELREKVLAAGLVMPMLIAPTTPAERAATIARASTGFVYLLARTGITGESGVRAPSDGPSLADRVRSLRAVTDLPIACGFGIASPDDVRAVVHAGGADAAIVGSALVRRLDAAEAELGPSASAHDRAPIVLAATRFTEDLVRAARS